MVYAAEISGAEGEKKGRKLTFQVSGMLWKRSLVMRDVETESLWSHILGECMQGELRGATLRVIPSVMTTWADWKAEHPKTTVLNLSRTAKAYDRKFYRKLERFVLGAVIQGKPVAYPFDFLKEHRVFDDEVDGETVLVVFDAKSTRAALFNRNVAGRVLTFRAGEKSGWIFDRETSSRWSARSGRCEEGKLAGKQLEVLPAIVSFRRAWKQFHPESRYPAR